VIRPRRSRKILLCEFNENTVQFALKSTVYLKPIIHQKKSKYMRFSKTFKESTSQKLLCYDCYGSGMSYIISTMPVGIALNNMSI
jgi:hypothetical protein